ncbi:MAG: hydrogenase maturation protease [Candidatus Thermoplasmatota archaeon]|nr:hydrogenase maturation protease [Candidatus Thermoplasmatota archaeon]
MQRPRNETLVVTLGSPLAGEDSIGCKIFERIKDKIDARVEYLGTDIFRFSNVYHEEEKVIFVDAVYSKKLKAGEMVYFRGENVFEFLNDVAVDAHMLGVGEGLKILREVMPAFPKNLHFIGISCKKFGFGEMSIEVEKGMEMAIKKIMEIV